MQSKIANPTPMRKSRSPRTGIGTGHGPFDWEASAEDWSAIESAYGRKLADPDRAQLTKHMSEYLSFESAERSAPLSGDAQDILKRIEKGASKFRETLLCLPSSDEITANATYRVWHFLDTALRDMPRPRPDSVTQLAHMLTHFLAACNDAHKGLEKDDAAGGFQEGTEWRALIRGLTKFAKDRGWPTSAPKDSDKRNKPAPFVAFVMALMATLPRESRRHAASWQACAQGIAQARRTRVENANAREAKAIEARR